MHRKAHSARCIQCSRHIRLSIKAMHWMRMPQCNVWPMLVLLGVMRTVSSRVELSMWRSIQGMPGHSTACCTAYCIVALIANS